MAKKNLYRKIEKIAARENSGSYGAWRREFCGKYRELLSQARRNSYEALVQKLNGQNKKISCCKKCTHCCSHYVAAPVAHGIAIADYLYSDRKKLQQFIHNYKNWHRQGYTLARTIDRTRNDAFSSSMPIDDIIAITRPPSSQYLEMEIPCPFLVKKSCLIYTVRPFPCSGQYSVSPPDWCAPDSGEHAEIYQLVPNDEDLMKMLELVAPQLMLHEVSLPILIYTLLTEGILYFQSSFSS